MQNKVQVTLMDGSKYETAVKDFDPAQLNAQLADPNVTHITIGDIVAHRATIAHVIKLA